MFRAAIFDVDGTLIDSVDAHARAWQIALEKFGHPEPFDKVRHQIGKGGDQLLPVFLSEQQLKEYGEELEKFRSELYKRDFMHNISPFKGVRELFQKMRAEGIQTVLASSAKGDELEYYKKLCRVEDLIEGNTSADDAEKSKPHPDIFQAALAQVKRNARSAAIVIGDTPYDAIAAKRAGLPCIGMLCGGFPAQELRDSGCVALYRDPMDLLSKFDSSVFGSKAA